MKRLILVAVLVFSATAAEAGPLKATGKFLVKGTAKCGAVVAAGAVKGLGLVGKGVAKVF